MFCRVIIVWCVCLAAAANSIIGGGDFLYNYNLRNGLGIEQTVWGYVLFPDKLRQAERTRYIMTNTRGESKRAEAFTFRFMRRIYPVAPQTVGIDPGKLYELGQLNFTLSTHRPDKNTGVASGLCIMRERVHAANTARRSTGPDSGPMYFSNLENCTNLFKVVEEKIVIYPKENMIMFERDGRKEIRALENAGQYKYYGFAESPGLTGFIVNEFTDITLWDRLDPAPTQPGNNYYRHVYTGYRNDGKYGMPEMAYWRGRSFYDGGFEAPRSFPDAVGHFGKAAAAEHVFAVYYLALCHYFGVGVPRGGDTANALLKEAAARQYDRAMALYGLLHDDREMLEKAAVQGNAEALYLTGELEKAAARGHAKAVYRLGMQALERKDLEAARRFFTRTLELRFAPGMTRLGELSAATRTAPRLYEQAAELGDPDAMFLAGWYHYLNDNTDEAGRYMAAGAALDDPRCKVALALFDTAAGPVAKQFFTGDRDGALRHWRSNPTPYGSYAAGICYSYGFGVEQDPEQGAALLGLAADKGVSEAFYETGRILEADGKEALAAEAYAKSSLPQAKLGRAKLLSKLNPRDPDMPKLLAEAANAGNLEAMRLYGEYLEFTAKRPAEASQWWGKYLDGQIRRDNNSVPGPYWRELPCCLPPEIRDGVPVDYRSDLDDPRKIREIYQKYGH